MERWAKEAGHALDEHNKCVKCHIHINMSRSQAYLEAVLHMKCLGAKGTRPCVSLHTKGQHDMSEEFEHYFFHGLRVHKSHTMATHGGLMLHFCTYCGSYGKSRANNLQKECPQVVSKYGKQALNMLKQDKHPVNQNKTPEVPHAHIESGISRSSHSGKLRKPRLLLGLKSAFEGRAAVSAGAVKFSSRAEPPVCNINNTKSKPTNSKDEPSRSNSIGRPPGDSTGCPRCWPLGASTLGYCICKDLDLLGIFEPTPPDPGKLGQSGPSIPGKRTGKPNIFRPCAMKKARLSSTTLIDVVAEGSQEHAKHSVSNSIKDHNNRTSSRGGQDSNIGCSRCWDVGASALGYCICEDLALVGMTPPSGN